jgi:large subunit ribosomal protein L18
MTKVGKRRRREGKTDYQKRIKLLRGGKPRVTFRKTNRYIISQYIKSSEAQDRPELGVSSRDLLKYGWPKEAAGSLKSIPAAYFTGLLLGKKIKERRLKEPILDFGMSRTVHRSRGYAFLKGLEDSGISTKHDEGIFPEESRIKGGHMKNKIPFEKIKSEIEK